MKKKFENIQHSNSISLASQAPESQNALFRKRSLLRSDTIQTPEINRVRNIIENISHVIANIRSSAFRPAADNVIHKPSYIAEIIDLNKSIEEVIKRLELILNIFSAPYDKDQTTGEIALTLQNTENLKSRLRMSHQQLTGIVPTHNTIQENLNLFEPDNRMAQLIQELENPHLSTKANPRAITQVMDILNDYLKGFIEATKLGVSSNIISTSNKIAELQITTEKVDEQQREAEAFGITDNSEIRNNWLEIVYKVEFTLAHLYLRLNKIYGPSAAWLLDQVEVDALKKFYQQLIEKEKILKQELGGKNQENGLFDKMKEALTGLMKTRKDPTRSHAQIKTDLHQTSGTKKQLREHLRKRKEQ